MYKSSELLTLSTGSWRAGPDLPKATRGAQLITFQNKTYHIGGHLTRNHIYFLDRENDSAWKWVKLDTKLKKDKVHFSAVPIKLSTTDCNGWD